MRKDSRGSGVFFSILSCRTVRRDLEPREGIRAVAVCFNILSCRTTRRDSRGSGEELQPQTDGIGRQQRGMPARPK